MKMKRIFKSTLMIVLLCFFVCIVALIVKDSDENIVIGELETYQEEAIPEVIEVTDPTASTSLTDNSISVAMYPYLDVERFEKVLLREWEKLGTNVSLKIEEWDCYTGEISECDVLMYDAVALTNLAENGYIQPIAFEDIEEPEGLIPFSLEGSTHNGEFYGVPFLLCGDVLIYYEDDVEIAEIDSIPELYAEVLERRKADEKTGVLIYDGEDHYPYYYLEALADFTGEYTMYEQLPDCSNLNQQVLQILRDLHALAVEPPDDMKDLRHGEMFAQGTGFAFFGMTDYMDDMGELPDKLKIKPISYTERENIPMYYIDVTSVASHVTDPEKLQLCKKLMNMVSSEEFIEAWFLEYDRQDYLFPARQNVYLKLAEKYPMYGQMYEIAMDERNEVVRAGTEFSTYLETFPDIFN